MKKLVAAALLSICAACGSSSSPSAPSSSASPSPAPAAAVATNVSLTGKVMAFEGTAIQNAIVTILDGVNAGKSRD